MNQIAAAFNNKKAFIPFLTAGDPELSRTEEYILELEAAGADLIEIGIPFSDPVAEGPVIQEADIRALASGTTTDGIFDMVISVRKKTGIPLIFMTYLNPVFHYGYEKFFSRCEEAGIDGIIIPDLPFEEKEEVRPTAKAHNVTLISMIAPTSRERIKKIAGEAEGFLYVVSSMGVTGMRDGFAADLPSILATIKETTDIPAAVGFGIHTPAQAARMAEIADGVIVGSAVEGLIAQYGGHAHQHLYTYVRLMKDAVEKAGGK